MSEVISDFIDYITKEKRVSQNTLQAYVRDMQVFSEDMEKSGRDVKSATREDILNFKQHLIKNGFSNATVCRIMSSVRGLYKFLTGIGLCETNPAKEIKNEKVEKKYFEILSGKEVELLLALPDTNEVKGIRDKAMLETLYATGMKVSELTSLDVEDVNLQLGFIKCHGEGPAKHERVIFLYPLAVKALSLYLKNGRNFFVMDPQQRALFVNVNGERMTRQGFWKLLKTYASKANIKKTITPHTLRHSFAAHLLENGADLKDIKEILGHADISSTMIYAQYLKNKIGNSYLKYHPRA